MDRSLLSCAVALVWFCSACGGERACDKAKEYADACANTGAASAGLSAAQSCEDRIDQCSDTDKKLLENWFECLASKPCNDVDSMTQCAANVAGLSNECAQGFTS